MPRALAAAAIVACAATALASDSAQAQSAQKYGSDAAKAAADAAVKENLERIAARGVFDAAGRRQWLDSFAAAYDPKRGRFSDNISLEERAVRDARREESGCKPKPLPDIGLDAVRDASEAEIQLLWPRKYLVTPRPRILKVGFTVMSCTLRGGSEHDVKMPDEAFIVYKTSASGWLATSLTDLIANRKRTFDAIRRAFRASPLPAPKTPRNR